MTPDLPPGLPPLPPVPPGFDRWEYRGTNYAAYSGYHDHCEAGDDCWFRTANGYDLRWTFEADEETHAIEAVREPAKECKPMPDAINAAISANLFALLDPENGEELDAPAKEPAAGEARVFEDGWMPIESAPEKPGWYLGSFDGALRCVGYDSLGWGFWGTPSDQRIEELTHWQPLPPPPTTEDHE